MALWLPLSFPARGAEPGVSSESWVWRDLDRLRAAGLLESGTSGSRTAGRAELARLTAEARALAGERPASGCAAELDRLAAEFAAELDAAAGGPRGDYLLPLEDLRLSFTLQDGRVDAFNDRGREYREGGNFRLSAASRFAWGPLSGRVRWEGRLLPADGDGPEDDGGEQRDRLTAGRVEEMALRLSAGRWFIEAGRECLWWGPGRHGSLLLSDNARPFDMLRVGNAEPLLLPGPLSRLGPVRVEAFLTRLEESRDIPEPFLCGARLSILPAPWLELGASRVAIFGGRGRPVTWTTVRNVATARNENEPDGAGNQLAAVDLRLTVPWAVQSFELYAEWGGEDEAGGFFSREALLAGLYLPRLGRWELFDLRLEYADTWLGGHDGHDRVWYTHGTYSSGYTHQGRFIGHHAGTDAQDLFVELGAFPQPGLRLAASFDLERRELSMEHPEERRQWGLAARWSAWRALTLEAEVLREEVSNTGGVRGQETDGTRMTISASWRF